MERTRSKNGLTRKTFFPFRCFSHPRCHLPRHCSAACDRFQPPILVDDAMGAASTPTSQYVGLESTPATSTVVAPPAPPTVDCHRLGQHIVHPVGDILGSTVQTLYMLPPVGATAAYIEEMEEEDRGRPHPCPSSLCPSRERNSGTFKSDAGPETPMR